MKKYVKIRSKKVSKEPLVVYGLGLNNLLSNKIFFKSDNIILFHQDILKFECPTDLQPDLIVTSPPYNVDIKYNSHRDNMNFDEYLEFTEKWLKRCYDFSKDTTRFCLNIPLDKNKGSRQSVGGKTDCVSEFSHSIFLN